MKLKIDFSFLSWFLIVFLLFRIHKKSLYEKNNSNGFIGSEQNKDSKNRICGK